MQRLKILQAQVFIVVYKKLRCWKNSMESAVFCGWWRITFSTHSRGGFCWQAPGAQAAGEEPLPPASRQGVNAESATHPRAALLPAFSEWSLLELKGCSWGGGYEFTRGYSAPDSLHKSTSKSEQTLIFFFLSASPKQWTSELCYYESRYDRTVRGLLICTAHNSHKHTESKTVFPYFSAEI